MIRAIGGGLQLRDGLQRSAARLLGGVDQRVDERRHVVVDERRYVVAVVGCVLRHLAIVGETLILLPPLSLQ